MTTQQKNRLPDPPAGYMRKANGDLTPTEHVREQDLLRDDVVRNLAGDALFISEQLLKFKKKALQEIADLITISGEKYGVNLGGKQGNVQLHTYDGTFRIERVHAKVIAFTEELQAAKQLVENCILKWSDGADTRLKALVMKAFKPNAKGELRTSAVVELLRLEIDDPDWKMAMEALKDSMNVSGVTTYIRVYKRIVDSDRYRLINLDLAGVSA